MFIQDIWNFSELIKPLYVDIFVFSQEVRLFVVCLKVMPVLELVPCGKLCAVSSDKFHPPFHLIIVGMIILKNNIFFFFLKE
jgi:hypothetical protein